MDINIEELNSKSNNKVRMSFTVTPEVKRIITRVCNVTGVSKSAFVNEIFLDAAPNIELIIDSYIESKLGKLDPDVIKNLKDKADKMAIDLSGDVRELASLLDN